MAEEVASERPPAKEIPPSAFDEMQAFLEEKGQLVTHSITGTNVEVQELQYQRSDVWFLSHFSFPDLPPQGELIKNIVNLTISQRQVASPDSPPSDIEVTLAHRGQLKLGKATEELPEAKQTSRVTVINPESGKREKVIIEPFNPLGKWLDLSKDKWQEIREEYSSHWVTTSEQEAKKIVSQLMIPEEKHRVGRKITSEPKISRRGFLALMGIGAKAAVLDSLLSHIPFAPSLSKAFWEQLETATLGIPAEKLKNEIRDRFQVEIVGPSTGVRTVGEFGPSLGKQYPTVEWDSPRLKGLIGALSELSPHFYLPRIVKGQEHKVRFVLTDVPLTEFGNAWRGDYQGGFCDCSVAEKQTVVLDKKHLNQTIIGAGHGREVWFHEITHALTSPETERYVQAVSMPIGIQTIDDLREIFFSELRLKRGELKGVNIFGYYGDELIKDKDNRLLTLAKPDERARELIFIGGNRITVQKSDLLLLGEEYIKEELAKFVRKSHPEIATLEEYLSDPPGLGKVGIGMVNVEGMNQALEHKSIIGYGARNFQEFFSVAAEYYSKGRSEFVKTYMPYLGKERAEKLYNGMKQEIFGGREY